MSETSKATSPEQSGSEVTSKEVDHPPHYNNRRMEAIDIIELIIEIEKNPKVAYNMSNVLKYLLRFRDKGTPLKDLRKARWYLNRMTEKVEQELAEDTARLQARASKIATGQATNDRHVPRFGEGYTGQGIDPDKKRSGI